MDAVLLGGYMAARNAPLESTPIGAFTTGADCAPVVFNSLSGPLGSPYDAMMADPSNPNGSFIANPDDLSTGAAVTGIGFSSSHAFPDAASDQHYNDFASVLDDEADNTNYVPGVSGNIEGSPANGILLAIGGGYCAATENGAANPYPWNTGFSGIGFMGGGVERDLLSTTPDQYVASTALYQVVPSPVDNGDTIDVLGISLTNRSGVTLETGDAAGLVLEAASVAPYPVHTLPFPSLS